MLHYILQYVVGYAGVKIDRARKDNKCHLHNSCAFQV